MKRSERRQVTDGRMRHRQVTPVGRRRRLPGQGPRRGEGPGAAKEANTAVRGAPGGGPGRQAGGRARARADSPDGIFREVYAVGWTAPSGSRGRGGGKLIIDMFHGLAVFRT